MLQLGLMWEIPSQTHSQAWPQRRSSPHWQQRGTIQQMLSTFSLHLPRPSRWPPPRWPACKPPHTRPLTVTGWRSFGSIVGVSCLLYSSAGPGVWSSLRVTHQAAQRESISRLTSDVVFYDMHYVVWLVYRDYRARRGANKIWVTLFILYPDHIFPSCRTPGLWMCC